MANKTKRPVALILAIVMILVLLSPLLITLSATFLLPAVYSDTFVGELSEKYDRLTSLEDKKIVVVGGSSVAFGLDSEMIKESLGYEVVNFGLYASLGTKLMLDLSLGGIGEGDIVMIAPEINEQTLSLYFNPEVTMQAFDGSFNMLSSVASDNLGSLVGRMWGFASDKIAYTISGKMPENVGAYRKEWFNEYGDNTYDRPYNTMSTVTRSISFDFRYNKNDPYCQGYEEFIDYVNEYTKKCEKVGASVYFSFPPMCNTALSKTATEQNTLYFYNNLISNLNCRVISDINDYIIDEGYFFDSEFHLNNAGVVIRTVQLIDDLKRELGIKTLTMKESDLPEPPGYQPIDFGGENEENLYFILESGETGAGQAIWHITGLNEEGRRQTTLRIPDMVDGIPVAGIRPAAFKDSAVRKLGLGNNITNISTRAFADAENLSEVYVPFTSPEGRSIPNSSNEDGLATKGARDDLLIYVPNDYLSEFKQDYFWGDYSERLRGY